MHQLRSIVERFPPFRPHRLFRNCHLQTVAAAVVRTRRFPYRALPRPLLLEGGDIAFLHDDRPDGWEPTSPAAVLVHGLSGSFQSSYMVRIAGRLNEAGVRTFRMDLRACGAGEGLSSMPYHAGCSHDVLVALKRVVEICPASPITLIGFSVGGSIALKLLGELADSIPPQLRRAIIVSPPIDVAACVEHISQSARFYDRAFVRSLHRQLRRSNMLLRHAPHAVCHQRPRGMREFDTRYTSRVWGFETVDEFYADISSHSVIGDVEIPTLLMVSRDDPLIPVRIFEDAEISPSIRLHVTDHGGHLGFIGRPGLDPDCRWLDWRIVESVNPSCANADVAAAA